MEIEISGQSEDKLKKISEATGFSIKDILDRALILFYLSAVKDDSDLKKELDAWDKASNEDFENFENRL